MSKYLETEAILLAAGRQTRYGTDQSKLMGYIDGKPAFYFLMNNIQAFFPDEFITIITSNLFQDFNDFITTNYTRVNLIFDDEPGSGSAKTLNRSQPWKSNYAFVSESNIYYENYLINEILEFGNSNPDCIATLAITNQTNIAYTHRKIKLNNGLDLRGVVKPDDIFFSNMGVYNLRKDFLDYIGETNDIIEVINKINILGGNIYAIKYSGLYLHMEKPLDLINWKKTLEEEREIEK